MVVLVLVFVGCAIALAINSRRSKVSLMFVEYRRWPNGAILRLTNGTQATIRYLAGPEDGISSGRPILRLQKTTSGWTNTSPEVVQGMRTFDPRTGASRELFFLVDPAAPPKAGDRLQDLINRDLKPGQSEDFFVRLEPGASPVRIGTVCPVPRGAIQLKLQPWTFRVRQWFGSKSPPLTESSLLEIWCPDSLQPRHD